ncbi:uncharacterized protein LOC111240539 [Vigna radiata var. radiata]|uniref:Uncharacterized protein LOC111240539 n=1 Tax=Vigna radiata var. radiata TaxID=3916 RepID=A0A3Q0EM78_VIGRR|nr:uncharacterized protein LOC111240539 [Vigna radiata var. radiata]
MIKRERVAILMMIMLGFVEILSIEAKLPCAVQCGIQCFGSEYFYPDCLKTCLQQCKKVPASAYNCITKCGVNKTVTVTIDGRGHVTDVVDSCLRNCPSLED